MQPNTAVRRLALMTIARILGFNPPARFSFASSWLSSRSGSSVSPSELAGRAKGSEFPFPDDSQVRK
jgi:hypothetical protein